MYSPDGSFLASLSWFGDLVIWDLLSGIDVVTIKPPSRIDTVAFSPNSKTILGFDYGDRIYFWDINSGSLQQTLPNRPKVLMARTFSLYQASDNELFVSDNGGAWDVQKWQQTHITPWAKLEGISQLKEDFENKGKVLRSRFQTVSEDGTLVGMPTADGCIMVWDVGTDCLKKELSKHNPGFGVISIQISPDNSMIISVASSEATYLRDKKIEIFVWDIGTGDKIADSKTHPELESIYTVGEHSSRRIHFMRNRRAFCMPLDNAIGLWDVDARKLTKIAPISGRRVSSIAVTADEMYCAHASTNTVSISSLSWKNISDENNSLSEIEKIGMKHELRDFLISCNGVVAINIANSIEFRDVDTWQLLFKDSQPSTPTVRLCFSNDGERVCYLYLGKSFIVRETRSFSQLFALTWSGPDCRCLGGPEVLLRAPTSFFLPVAIALSRDGTLLAIAHGCGKLELWDIDQKLNILSVEDANIRYNFAQFSPVEDVLICVTAKRTKTSKANVVCWALQQNAWQRRWEAESRLLTCFLSDGSRLLVHHSSSSQMEVLCARTGCKLKSISLKEDFIGQDWIWRSVTTEMPTLDAAKYVRSSEGYLNIHTGELDPEPPTTAEVDIFCRNEWVYSKDRPIFMIPVKFPPRSFWLEKWGNHAFLILRDGGIVRFVVTT